MSRPEQRRSPAKLWFDLWRALSRDERARLIVALVMILIGSIATAVTPLLVGVFVDSVYKDGQLVGLDAASGPIMILAATALVIGATSLVRHQQIHTVTTSFTAAMRRRIYAALLRWPLTRYINDARGALYGRANRSIEGAERLVMLGAADLLPAVLVTLFAVIIAIIQYGWLGLCMALVIPTGFFLVAWQIRSQAGIRMKVAAAKQNIDADVTSRLAGVDVIRTHGAEAYFDDMVAEGAGTLMHEERRHHYAMAVFDAIKLANETLWLVATLIVSVAFHSLSSPGEFASMVLLYLAITRPLRELHRVFDEGAEAALHTRNLQEDLAAPLDPSYTSSRSTASTDASTHPGVLSFKGVTFSYTSASTPVLTGIDLVIHPGERIGIVGASGCGKSTLLKLAARLMHGYTGGIYIDGDSIRSLDRAALVSRIGYVSQRPNLFQGSIRDSLLLGRGGIDDDALVLACKRANIHDDILAMPHGYDTIIGEEGGRLSGGQQQRLCLARALVATPPVLLLDEPTSALDGPSQASVQQAIDSLEDITVVIVAHRLSTLRTVDRIVVMDRGTIVEEGAYDALAASGGIFERMLASERRTTHPVA